jgi:hypothetical protein
MSSFVKSVGWWPGQWAQQTFDTAEAELELRTESPLQSAESPQNRSVLGRWHRYFTHDGFRRDHAER